MLNIRHIITLILVCVFTQGVYAQVDSLYAAARHFAFNGERQKARTLCDSVLKLSPQYSEVRNLKGRTYSWDGYRDSARIEFNQVLSYDSTNADTWESLSDLEFWDDKTPKSLDAANNGIRFNPKSKTLMLKRVRALVDLANYDDAKQTLSEIREIDSVCTECKVWYDKIYEARARSNMGFGSNIDFFPEINRELHNYYVQFGHKAPKNSVILRVNYNIRTIGSSSTTGFQPEIDMYPTVSKKAYLYVNYGFSIYNVFPRHRIGLELYHKLPASIEASIGGRYMDFGGNSKVYIFTGSITKYLGNYAIIFRPFITPDEVTKNVSRSGILNIRKYTSNADNFYGITAGAGFSPDQRNFLTGGTGFTTERTTIYFLQAYRIGVAFSKTFTFKHLFIIDFDYRYQELKMGPSSSFYHTFSPGFSYKHRF